MFVNNTEMSYETNSKNKNNLNLSFYVFFCLQEKLQFYDKILDPYNSFFKQHLHAFQKIYTSLLQSPSKWILGPH